MRCDYTFLRVFIIPLVAALIGGSTTLIGVILTIRHENKKSLKSYIEKIRPFFVVESLLTTNIEIARIKTAYVSDDSTTVLTPNDTIIHWNGLLLTNVSDAVCVFEYVRIDEYYYEAAEKIPIKSGESIKIMGFPLSSYIRKAKASQITIGVMDRLFNQYEYVLSFELKDSEQEGKQKDYTNRDVEFIAIDCSKNVFSKKKYKKSRKIKL